MVQTAAMDDIDCIAELVEFVRETRGFLFHVTDEAHRSSIAEHGLVSKVRAVAMDLSVPFPGGNGLTWALDDQYGLGDFVFLGFTPGAVMPKQDNERLRRPLQLLIDPSILYRPDVKIALGRANHRGTEVRGVRRAVLKMDHSVFEQVMRGTYDWNDFAMRPRIHRVFGYEVLVPQVIPPEYIHCAE